MVGDRRNAGELLALDTRVSGCVGGVHAEGEPAANIRSPWAVADRGRLAALAFRKVAAADPPR